MNLTPPIPSFSIAVSQADAIHTIAVAGELDIASEPELAGALGRALEATPGAIVVDLRDVAFMDSTGIRALAQARQRCTEAGRRLLLMSPSPHVLRPLEICGLAKTFDFVDSPDQVVARTA
jgi:anti-anti-sigma factor